MLPSRSDGARSRWTIPRGARAPLVGIGLLAAFAAIFLLNAWVSDDAYITFRSVSQLLAGNGPRWNPHERVQVFTHPLWFLVLSAGRLVIDDPFISMVALSFAACVVAILLAGRSVQAMPARIAAMAALLSSKAFIDYSSSGLENPLSYALMGAFVAQYWRIAASERVGERALTVLALLMSLLAFCRLDLTTIAAVPLLAVMLRAWRGGMPWRRVIARVAIAQAPLLAWFSFSLTYYGFLFPNPAYAKLGTGLGSGELAAQGLRYLLNSLRLDPVTLCTIALAIGFAARRRSAYGPWAIGLALNLCYVVRVGGDFMSGRFLAVDVFVAVVTLARLLPVASPQAWRRPVAAIAVGLVAVNVASPFQPWRTRPWEKRVWFGADGVADERRFYFAEASLVHYFEREPGRPFPDSPLATRGLEWKTSNEPVHLEGNIGFTAFFSGLDRIVIDPFALSDAFLARRPCLRPWRIGHFQREIPPDYVDSVVKGENVIVDPAAHQLYDDLKIVTQGPLFTWERWTAILRLNLR